MEYKVGDVIGDEGDSFRVTEDWMARQRNQAEATRRAAEEKAANEAKGIIDPNDKNFSQKVTAYITRDEWNRYLENYAPLEEELLQNSISDRSLIDNARTSQDGIGKRAEATTDRQMSRFGMSPTAAGRRYMERMKSLGGAKTGANVVNNAVIDQRERNLAQTAQLMNLGRGLSATATSGLADAAGMEANRNSANAQAAAQSKANKIGTATSLLTAAAMFAL